MSTIQLKRGEFSNLPLLKYGEPAYISDLKQLYIGSGLENVPLGSFNITMNPSTAYPVYSFKTASTSLDCGLNNTITPSIPNMFAFGQEVTVSGNLAFAQGYKTTASGLRSHAEGAETTASAINSHAEGTATTASGTASHAEGNGTQAQGMACHSEGSDTLATHNYSHAEGYRTKAIAGAAHAEGDTTTASGYGSHAEGHLSTASGQYAKAMGLRTTASGDLSFCGGADSIANNTQSFAYGTNLTSSGTASVALNNSNLASARFTLATGYWTNATGNQANAFGERTWANVNNMTALGTCNKLGTGAIDEVQPNNDIFIIGNGTYYPGDPDNPSDWTRSNAFRVNMAGRAYVQTQYVTGGADYAEYYEWSDGNPLGEDRVGYFVTFDSEGKIKYANTPNEYILGITSAYAGVSGNAASDQWHGMYQRDEFNRLLKTSFTSVNGNTFEINILSEDYDPEAEYVSREERNEWIEVGMLGKIRVRDDGTCVAGGKCSPTNGGIATNSMNGYYVIQRINSNVIEIIFR